MVYAVTKLVAYLVPDKPKFLDLQIKREAFLEKEALQQKVMGDEHANTEYV